MSNSSSATGGVSFGGLLFLVFLTLKLTEVIDWSWWWVTAPLWGPLAILFAMLVVAVPVLVVFGILVAKKKKATSDFFKRRGKRLRRNKNKK